MGVVVANGFVILLFEGAVGLVLDDRDLGDGENGDLDSFLKPSFFKLKGILSLGDVVCEQKVGVGESTIVIVKWAFGEVDQTGRSG